MIIALARLQFCRLLSAGKCPRGNGQIDSRVVVGLAVPKRELLQNDLGLGLEFEPREQESVIAQCSESLIIYHFFTNIILLIDCDANPVKPISVNSG